MTALQMFIVSLIGLILDHIPHEEAQQLLSEEAKRRANEAADVVVAARIASERTMGL